MRRFFAEKLEISGGEAVLCGDEARHIKNVLRYKTGDEVLLIDGGGAETLGTQGIAEKSVLWDWKRITIRSGQGKRPRVLILFFYGGVI